MDPHLFSTRLRDPYLGNPYLAVAVARVKAVAYRVILALAVLGGIGFAASDACDARELTALEAGPLGNARVVVHGALDSVSEVGVRSGRQLLSVRVIEIFKQSWPKGSTRRLSTGDVVHVAVRGPRGVLGTGQARPLHFQPDEKGKCVFFLNLGASGGLLLQSVIRENGSEGSDKVDAVRTIARFIALPDRAVRERKLIDYLLTRAGGRGRWSRVNATRELHHIARVAPDLFGSSERKRIDALMRRALTPDQQHWLQQLMRTLGPSDEFGEPPTGEDLARDDEKPGSRAKRRTDTWLRLFDDATTDVQRESLFTQLLAAMDPSDPDPRSVAALLSAFGRSSLGLQRWVLDRLIYNRCYAIVPRLRVHYARTVAIETREMLIRAIGLLGEDLDVGWLTQRMKNRELRRAVLLALARIRSSAALQVLKAEHARALSQSGASARAEAAWLAYLLSDDFAVRRGAKR